MPPAATLQACTFRSAPRPSDAAAIRAIVVSTGFFSEAEVDVAVELVDERLAKGEASGYHFLFAERAGRVLGYACFGPIACTVAGFDLYWIAVHQGHRGAGLGRALLEHGEAAIVRAGGQRIYVETSSKPQYQPTRAFYLRCGYAEEAVITDFYAPGDSKVIYVKPLLTRPA